MQTDTQIDKQEINDSTDPVPPECEMDGCDTSLTGSLRDAGFGEGGIF